jgi:hypothetical protein
MTDFIIAAIVLVIVGAASWYVYKAKKSGKKCIGCPKGGCSKCSCGCGKSIDA